MVSSPARPETTIWLTMSTVTSSMSQVSELRVEDAIGDHTPVEREIAVVIGREFTGLGDVGADDGEDPAAHAVGGGEGEGDPGFQAFDPPSHRGLRRARRDRGCRGRRPNRRSIMADCSSGPAGVGGRAATRGRFAPEMPGRSWSGSGSHPGGPCRGPVAGPIRPVRPPSVEELTTRRRNAARGRGFSGKDPPGTSRRGRCRPPSRRECGCESIPRGLTLESESSIVRDTEIG